MKIAIAVHHFPPDRIGGAELRAFDAALWFVRHDHDPQVICVEHIDRGADNGITWQDDQYQGIPVRRLSFNIARSPDKIRYEYDNPWIEEHLKAYLSVLKPDVFHLFSGYIMGAGAVRAARSLAIPVVITLTDFWFICPRINLLHPNGAISNPDRFDPEECARCKLEEMRRFRIPAALAPGIVNRLWKLAFETDFGKTLQLRDLIEQFRRRDQVLMQTLNDADAVICPSRFLLEKFHLRGVDSEKLIFNKHGIDPAQWQPAASAPANPSKAFRIGYLGQIESHKGVHLLVEAFKSLRSEIPIELRLYGKRSILPGYNRLLEKLTRGDRRIKFKGAYKPSELGAILSKMDVIVIPSLWNEIGPLVLYEALQARVPVVASDIPNMSYEIQHGKNGLLFSCGDKDDLARQLQRLLDSPQLLADLRSGIEPVRHIDQEMEQIVAIYQRVTARKTPAPLS